MDNRRKYLFEHRFISHRIKFIEDTNIDDLDKDYLESKLLEFSKKDFSNYYLSLLIDLAVDASIMNIDLLKAYSNQLFTKNHYLVKLSSLDYLFVAGELISNKSRLVVKLKGLLQSKYERLLVKNQILLLLAYLDLNNADKYLEMLRKHLSRTLDYRSHIRVYNTIMNFLPITEREREILWTLMEVSKNMDLGKAATEKVKEVEKYLSSYH